MASIAYSLKILMFSIEMSFMFFLGKQNGRSRDSITQQLVPDILLPLFSPWILSWTFDSYHI